MRDVRIGSTIEWDRQKQIIQDRNGVQIGASNSDLAVSSPVMAIGVFWVNESGNRLFLGVVNYNVIVLKKPPS